MHVDNTTHTVDVSGVDIDAEVAAAEAREREYNAAQRGETLAEDKPAAEPKARPDNVPEEFWDAEKGEVDWTKLNAKLKGEGVEESTDADQPTDLGDEINGHKLTTKHAEDFAPFYEAFEKDGAVPDDAVKYVEENFGIKVSKSMVEAYMAGQVSKASGQASEVAMSIRQEGLAVVGGETNYAAMSDWATNGVLTDAEIAEYDQAVNGNDPKVAKLAVQALWNRYRAEADIEPQVKLGNGKTTQTTGEGYPNMDAYVRDTMRPEYANDPAFRAKVDAKLARSGSLTLPNY